MPTVAIATMRDRPPGEYDDQLTLDALAALGVSARFAVWDDPAEDWGAFDLVVVRSTWDYSHQRDRYLEWARRVPRLLNPAPVLEWNTDKHYLRELEAAGVPVVPTLWSPDELPDWPELVVKPAVSAGAADTNRYAAGDPRAAAHLRRLAAEGRASMVQPYLGRVDEEGETALLFVRGAFSHAIRKGPLLQLGADSIKRESYVEEIRSREPSAAQRDVAEAALAAVPGGREQLLYARVDLLPTGDGPVVIELELTEPSLFLRHAPGSAERLARAITRRL